MPRTPDRFPGPTYEEGIYLSDEGLTPTTVGEFRNSGGSLLARDTTGVFNLRQGAGSSLLGRAVFLTSGSLVYTASGDVVIKEVE